MTCSYCSACPRHPCHTREEASTCPNCDYRAQYMDHDPQQIAEWLTANPHEVAKWLRDYASNLPNLMCEHEDEIDDIKSVADFIDRI